jgi:ribosomal protein L33
MHKNWLFLRLTASFISKITSIECTHCPNPMLQGQPLTNYIGAKNETNNIERVEYRGITPGSRWFDQPARLSLQPKTHASAN